LGHVGIRIDEMTGVDRQGFVGDIIIDPYREAIY
jgi:hypothetical protein